MNINQAGQLLFKTQADTKAFAKWYLGLSPNDAQSEFSTPEEQDEFLERRFARLTIQIDDLRNLKFTSANRTNYDGHTIYRLARENHEPLSSIGCDLKSSRFNYKEHSLFKTRCVYFGQDKDCCYSEIFHADFMRLSYPHIETKADELKRPKYFLYEYKIDIKDILVLTSTPTLKALGINESVLKDEWFDLNFEYDIPSSSQVLGAIAREQGFKGILYSSVRYQLKTNLVLFEENTGELKDLGFNLQSKTEFNLEDYEKSIGLKY